MPSSTAGTATTLVASTTKPTISLALEKFAKDRGISRTTLERMGVASGTAFFPKLGQKSEAAFFKYSTGWKARSIPTKNFTAVSGLKMEFWNLDRVLAGKMDQVFITEGEFDAVALVEAGISEDAVLSVPNGATARSKDDASEDTRGYSYVADALKAGLNRAKRLVWCGDNDPVGLGLRTDMARLFGAAKFNFVEWPEGCKDANDVLKSDGAQTLLEYVSDGTLPWPVAGLYRLNELPEPAPLEIWSTGIQGWDHKIMLAPRTLSVVTGQPGHGKTLLWCQLWFQIIKNLGLSACIASFESHPKPHMRRQLRTLHSGTLEKYMSDERRRKADNWINERYFFLVHPERRATLKWILDSAEVAVVRHGVKVVQIDPWNRLEATRTREENEHEYIARALRELSNFANDLNCHVQIVAHPAKMDGPRRRQPPELEDIAGAKAWDAMADQGFTVHRPALYEGTELRTLVSLYHRKARFDELGHPCKMVLNYNLSLGRYDLPEAPPETEVQEDML